MSIRVALVSVLLAGSASLAGPLDKRLVSAQATWVIHVDVEAALASSIGRIAMEDEEAREGLRELKSEFGVDVTRDVKGITVWGREAEGKDAVIVVHTTAVIDGLLDQFREEAGIEEVEAGGYELLRWSDGGESHYGHVRRTSRGDDRIVFIARRERDLVRGLEVADGDAPDATSRDSVIRGGPGEGAFVFVSIPDIGSMVPGEALEHAPAILGKIEGVRLEAGERAGNAFAEASVMVATTEDAQTVGQAANGAIAMCKLMAGGEPEVAELMKVADRLRISTDDRAVTLRLECEVDELRALLEQARDHHKKVEAKVQVEVEDEEEADAGDRKDSPVAAPDKPRSKKRN